MPGEKEGHKLAMKNWGPRQVSESVNFEMAQFLTVTDAGCDPGHSQLRWG